MTKKVKPQAWPKDLPHVLVLPHDSYTQLRELTKWVDAMPDSVDPGEHFWESIDELREALLEDCVPPFNDFLTNACVECHIETERTAAHGCTPGDLVALVQVEGLVEWHACAYVRKTRRVEPAHP